jgi:hypothetical protein
MAHCRRGPGARALRTPAALGLPFAAVRGLAYTDVQVLFALRVMECDRAPILTLLC